MPGQTRRNRKTNRPARTAKRTAATVKTRRTRSGKVKSATASKPLSLAITKVINRKFETKYVATNIFNQTPLATLLNGGSIYTKLTNLIPNIVQGLDGHQRLGDEISPVKMRVHVQYTWSNDLSGSYCLFVRQFHVTHKSIKDNEVYQQTDIPTEHATLIENGDNTTKFPDGRGGTWDDCLKPVYKEKWTPHKGSKTFEMQKNWGHMNTLRPAASGDATLSNPASSGNRQMVSNHGFSVKLPKTLKYDKGAYLPTNCLPLFGAYFGANTYVDTATMFNGGLAPHAPAYLMTINPILVTVRTELWYKDA